MTTMPNNGKITTPKGLTWDKDLGVGFLNVGLTRDRMPYDQNYFEKYTGYSQTEMGKKLDRFRTELVRKFNTKGAPVVDVGIGCGNFINTYGTGAFGYDINPNAVRWLAERNLWWDPWQFDMPVATFWDSLEHFQDPSLILDCVKSLAFISIPIFRDPQHAEASKHFRPDEHYWYFTRNGLVRFMMEGGFSLAYECTVESQLGREDIHTFVFRRATR